MLYAGMLFMVYIGWVFSFKKAILAVKLNTELHAQQVAENFQDASYPQVNRKHNFYTGVIKGYRIKKEDRANRVWQSVSGMAINLHTAIGFEPEQITVPDTAMVLAQQVQASYTFKGSYFQMVKVLDSASRTNGIGKISAFKLGAAKALSGEEGDQMQMSVTFSGIEH